MNVRSLNPDVFSISMCSMNKPLVLVPGQPSSEIGFINRKYMFLLSERKVGVDCPSSANGSREQG